MEQNEERQEADVSDYGLIAKTGEGMSRVQMSCMHQSGLLYVVPSEKSWVCSQDLMPAHALAGCLREIVALEDTRVKEIMQRWGVYFRQLPIESDEEERAEE